MSWRFDHLMESQKTIDQDSPNKTSISTSDTTRTETISNLKKTNAIDDNCTTIDESRLRYFEERSRQSEQFAKNSKDAPQITLPMPSQPMSKASEGTLSMVASTSYKEKLQGEHRLIKDLLDSDSMGPPLRHLPIGDGTPGTEKAHPRPNPSVIRPERGGSSFGGDLYKNPPIANDANIEYLSGQQRQPVIPWSTTYAASPLYSPSPGLDSSLYRSLHEIDVSRSGAQLIQQHNLMDSFPGNLSGPSGIDDISSKFFHFGDSNLIEHFNSLSSNSHSDNNPNTFLSGGAITSAVGDSGHTSTRLDYHHQLDSGPIGSIRNYQSVLHSQAVTSHLPHGGGLSMFDSHPQLSNHDSMTPQNTINLMQQQQQQPTYARPPSLMSASASTPQLKQLSNRDFIDPMSSSDAASQRDQHTYNPASISSQRYRQQAHINYNTNSRLPNRYPRVFNDKASPLSSLVDRGYSSRNNMVEKPFLFAPGNGMKRRNNKLQFMAGLAGPGFGSDQPNQQRVDAYNNTSIDFDNNERFSRKVFVGGLPPDIDEEEIKASFRRFGSLIVDWPHKAESKSYFPPKGYAFLLFQEESSVQSLIDACLEDDDKFYLCVSSPTIKDKAVQIRPWRLCDADFVLDSTLTLDPRKTVFVGGVPRPMKASELATVMNNLYGGVCYAGIDTDPELKYPKGAGRVAFSTHQSYIAAISARFVHLQHSEIEKRVEIKPYVLDDQLCDECHGAKCGNKFAPFFCANINCLRYYCDHCWSTVHSQHGKDFHKPLVKEGADRPRGVPFRWC